LGFPNETFCLYVATFKQQQHMEYIYKYISVDTIFQIMISLIQDCC